jgi:hypothetical protein
VEIDTTDESDTSDFSSDSDIPYKTSRKSQSEAEGVAGPSNARVLRPRKG